MAEICRWSAGDNALNKGPLCCVIGNFDGVHKGHQALIKKAYDRAQSAGLPLAVICFNPHPRRYFQPSHPPFLLMDSQTKYALLFSQKVEQIIEITFDHAIQNMSPEGFVKDVLKDALNVKYLFAGADFAFGKGRVGTMQSLQEYGRELDMQVQAVSLVAQSAEDIISSTAIRTALENADLPKAEALLGRAHIIAGPVIEGDKRGRLLNFPTANIALADCLAPAYGVYAVTAELEDEKTQRKTLCGVANIGKRPTVNDRGILAEAHLFDFDQDIYGKRLCLYLHKFLRAEQKFTGLDALTAQIAKDAEAAKTVLRAQGHIV